ncbi:hypothetical protein BKA65DRAFT_531325 [Rhexocercosporidium sp. MPI-PUGE-AT-0058]|nr:hypothetical protein BKA65DRAFT_531325 [Rhexocercosporidium sp. MPI-PUGE-AT-0058]
MTNNNNINDTVDAPTTPTIPLIDRVPHIPLFNANNTRESFKAAFTTNPTGLIDEVLCNAAYGMQATIETLRDSQTDINNQQTRLENTFITKSDGDAIITRLMGERLHRRGPHLSAELPPTARAKTRMNKDWWSSESQRMGYVISCLKGKAHDQVSYYIKEILKSAFSDIDAKATAQLKTFDMKQGHKSLISLPNGALITHLRLSFTKGKDVPTELT